MPALLALLLNAARAGDLVGEVSVDTLHATSVSDEAGAGPERALSATELGFRVRLDLRELDERLELNVDYRDVEPVAGTFPNRALRLLYAGELRYAVVEDHLVVGLGRFLAPAAVLTPVDGARVEVEAGDLRLAAYGGRRGFTQSRANLPFGDMLPAAGGSVGYTVERLHLTALGGWSVDRYPLLVANPVEQDVGGGHALLTVSSLPVDGWRVGGQGAFLQQASYQLGPAWSDLAVEVEAFDVWRGLVWTDVEPKSWLRLGADLLHQEVGVYGAGSVDGAGVQVALQEPRFTDARLEGDVGLWKHGWLRPLGRYRIRPDRREVRVGSALDLDDLGVAGPFVSGLVWVDDVEGEVPDRVLWSASAGWDRGVLELEAGASFVERELGPFGSRRADGASGEDLQPFVLEAQKVGFLRGFLSMDQWFAGLDLERSLVDPEVRVFLQVGALGEVGW